MDIVEDKRLADLRRYRKNWEHRHWENRLWNNAKRNARSKNRPFNIEESDIIIPTHCPILGIPLVRGSIPKNTNNDGLASLDCIDPELGYTKGNIWVISFLANKMKQNATKEQLIAFCNGMLKQIEGGLFS